MDTLTDMIQGLKYFAGLCLVNPEKVHFPTSVYNFLIRLSIETLIEFSVLE
jgi:hypothetical protein